MKNLIIEGYRNKLNSKLYGLLCEYEKGGEWEKFLDTILVEIMPEEDAPINQFILYTKLSKLRYLSYKWFRKTIFDCMSLISKETKQEDVF